MKQSAASHHRTVSLNPRLLKGPDVSDVHTHTSVARVAYTTSTFHDKEHIQSGFFCFVFLFYGKTYFPLYKFVTTVARCCVNAVSAIDDVTMRVTLIGRTKNYYLY